MKAYRLLDYLTYKLGVLERQRDKRAYNQCLRTLKYIETELKKIEPKKQDRKKSWDNNMFFEKKGQNEDKK